MEETKDKSLRQPADGEKGKAPVNESEKKTGDLLKQRINNFLIIYFNYLTLALAFIILIVGLFIFIYPRYQQITKSDETAKKNLQTEFETQSSYLSAIRDLKSSYQLISGADIKKIEEMVPVGSEAVNLIPEIESMALRNGVVLNSIKVEPADPASQAKLRVSVDSGEKQEPPAGIFEQLPAGVGLAKIEINLSSVNYPIFKNLLKTFENNLRLLDVAEVNYNVQENRAVFVIYAYYLIR